jgi:uncharacterized protein YcfJ
MKALMSITLAVAGLAIATQASAEITFYQDAGFQGRYFTTQRQVGEFTRYGFNHPASSVVVTSNRWEVCEDPRFGGRCVVLRQGQYPSLEAMGLHDGISSVRSVSRNAQIDDGRYAPPPVVAYDYRRRNNERLYEASVTSVRAVVGPPEQRCWVEREEVVVDRREPNARGAIIGAVIGGILGHQVGGRNDKGVATVGGVVAGAAVGGSIGGGNHGQQVVSRDVQRCDVVPSQAEPDYWDVTYIFQGREYGMQMTSPPGATVTVNRNGEPRG